ncbi:MAG: saccharopine dehydrogenase NADP-binding domain-containing protein, partial [Nitrospirota bacterium]|nr:saccharopine dehydrogenase NADP-binding domain-containing protein [Nitrospirota bacterium]MDH5585287.1 saccharopine dehydrogenase NADP-binding domain-containing protein [Nitrospirota bacterium]MDH5775725.1 saccharopine dehydrogenase NADP-binding domain-containing protein [Nitrospirota bacterium]
MRRVVILGGGKIGSLIATLLVESGDYLVFVGDVDSQVVARLQKEIACTPSQILSVDVQDKTALGSFLEQTKPGAILSSLPYYCNPLVSELALELGAHYFDLTEDIEVTKKVREMSKGTNKAFVPQCGLAPGFISIVAHDLMTHFDSVEIVKMRVGALPVNPSNVLKYSLTWSTDGLINEYGNMCNGIENGQEVELLPLEGYETISIDGLLYEAFNTSGGLGTLADTYAGKVRTMNYKTLRYPGHCEKIHLLMNELKLNDDRETLKRVLEKAVPKTLQDVVLIYTSVTGLRRGELFEENFVKKIYPRTIAGKLWSAIQVTTAAGICSVMELVFEQPEQYRGFVTQETFDLSAILDNRFGKVFAGEVADSV